MGGYKHWGQLTVVDLHKCKYEMLTSKDKLSRFCIELCEKIKMVPHGKPIIKRFGESSLEGISGIQFIETSTITVHLDEFDNRAFIDIFSCKKFDPKTAVKFCKEFFQAERVRSKTIYRG